MLEWLWQNDRDIECDNIFRFLEVQDKVIPWKANSFFKEWTLICIKYLSLYVSSVFQLNKSKLTSSLRDKFIKS